jgi:hypothetical protein
MIAVALDGTVLVSDSGKHEMVGYSPTGDEVYRWPIVNAGPFCGGTQHAHPLVVGQNGELYVAELNAGQIHQYTLEGDLVRTFGGSEEGKGRFVLGPLGLVLDERNPIRPGCATALHRRPGGEF